VHRWRWAVLSCFAVSGMMAGPAESVPNSAPSAENKIFDHTALWGWGYNDHDQILNGTRRNCYQPELIQGVGDVIAVAGGIRHCLAVQRDGTVRAWGVNWNGELGNGTRPLPLKVNDRNPPGLVTGLNGVVAVAGGSEHSLALKADGTVWAWG